MGGVLWLLFGLLQVWWSAPYLGPDGGERFMRLPERRAQILHENFATRVHDFLLVASLAISLLGLVFALITSSVVAAVVWGVDVVVLLLGLTLRRRAQPVVLAAFRERGLQPLQEREFSAKRHQRQKQFGLAALTGFLVGETATIFGERQNIPTLDALAAGALLLAFVAIGALLWSTAWVYGDETASR